MKTLYLTSSIEVFIRYFLSYVKALYSLLSPPINTPLVYVSTVLLLFFVHGRVKTFSNFCPCELMCSSKVYCTLPSKVVFLLLPLFSTTAGNTPVGLFFCKLLKWLLFLGTRSNQQVLDLDSRVIPFLVRYSWHYLLRPASFQIPRGHDIYGRHILVNGEKCLCMWSFASSVVYL
jgi:hypothetical protein